MHIRRLTRSAALACLLAWSVSWCVCCNQGPATARGTVMTAKLMSMSLSSPDFNEGEPIPVAHACGPDRRWSKPSPALVWDNAPRGTKSFVLLMDDLHDMARGWVHWLVVDIPATATRLSAGASGTNAMPAGARELANTWGEARYGGPCPPPPTGRHTYRFRLYALPAEQADLATEGMQGPQLDLQLQSKALAYITLTAVYP